MKKKQKKLIGIIGAGILLVLGGIFAYSYFSNDDVSKPKQEQTEKEESKLKIVNLDSKSRPYAIMINNVGAARKVQSGLQDAYILYEMVVEGGITRYLALFLDQDTARIGSIRSARHYYLDYAMENDAIYVHHGQSDQAAADFKTLSLDKIVVSESKTGWRENPEKLASEHTLFTSIEKLNSGLGKKRTERKGDLLLDYSVEELDLSTKEGAVVASNVEIPFSSSYNSQFAYDPVAKVYKHSVNGKEHIDYVTKEQYTFKNIIAYQVKNYALNDGSGKGRQGLENIGSGEGYLITLGYAVPIKWEKTSRSAKTKYTYMDGTEIVVNDGNTFIEIYPTTKDMTIN